MPFIKCLKMAKHKLLKRPQSSLQFNSSSDDSRCFGKSLEENPKMTSNAGAINTSTPLRRSLRRPPVQTSVPEKDVATQETTNVKNQSPTKVDKSSPTKVHKPSPTKVDKPIMTKGDKHSTAAQEDLQHPTKYVSDSESELDSFSDSMCINSFFSSSSQKLPYSYEEDEDILKFILRGQNVFKVTSILIWKQLAEKKPKPKRTYQSLKNRFLRNIKPKLFTTYRHLIPDEETVQKILSKFPELKKDIAKKGTLSKLKLPERTPAIKMPPDAPEPDDGTDSEYFESEPGNVSNHVPVPSTSRKNGNELNFHRKVTISNESLTILVNLKFEHPPPKTTRIYERYLNLKLKNKLSRCSACGRSGGPELRPDSGAESDSFISNSVESKDTPKKKRLLMCKTKTFQSPKKKKKNFVPEPCNNQRACSPSLLNDVNEVVELGENPTKDAESQRGTTGSVSSDDSDALIKERNSTEEEHQVASRDTDSFYQNTVAEFRKLIDSDEEEMLVKKCLRKNSKTIGFNPNMAVEEVHVDSYFIKSCSPGLQSGTVNDSRTGNAVNRITTRSISGASLAKNMMNMMGKTN